MAPDQVAEMMRQLLREALVLGGPVLLAASLTSFLLSLAQTLTSLQEQTLTTVPRLLIVVALMLVGMPWFLGRLVAYTVRLLGDFHRYLG
jgi:flagellar biosynthetic protein FliQ